MDCLSDRQLRKLKSGALKPELRELRIPWERHLARCESCQARMEKLRAITNPGSGSKKKRRRTGEHDLPQGADAVTDPTAARAPSPIIEVTVPAGSRAEGPPPTGERVQGVAVIIPLPVLAPGVSASAGTPEGPLQDPSSSQGQPAVDAPPFAALIDEATNPRGRPAQTQTELARVERPKRSEQPSSDFGYEATKQEANPQQQGPSWNDSTQLEAPRAERRPEPPTKVEVRRVELPRAEPPRESGPPSQGPAPAYGSNLGEFLILEPLWAEEPCELFAAFDQANDRRVTLRVLELEGDWANGAAKILADARALNELSHPAIPRVLGITTRGSQALIALEPEDGVSLDVWLSDRKRSRAERVQLFVGVANALAVLHHAGLVHGALRPSAIRITADGSVRLSELTVQRPVRADGRSGRRDTGGVNNASRAAQMYAAPERKDLSNVDWRAEQFSFCAVFFEALTGQLPYPSEASALQEPVASRKVPSWLRAILVRGLSRVREQRFESMRALSAELRQKRRRRLPRVLRALAVAAAVAGVAFGVWRFRGERMPAATSCSEASARLEKAWNPDRKEQVRTGLLATKRAFAAKTADGVISSLDGYTQTWQSSFRAVCALANPRATASVRLCLEQRMLDVEALTEALSHAEARAAIRAIDASRALLDPTECATGTMLSRKLPESPGAGWTAAVSEGMRHLARARAFAETDQPWRAPVELARTLELSSTAPDPWLGAEALVLQGTLKARQADGPNAERVLRKALLESQSAGHASGAARAAGQLGYVYGVLLGRGPEAEHAFEQAFAHAGYVADDVLTARLLLLRASVYEVLRQPAKGLEDAERALSLLKGRGEATVHSQAAALNAMGRASAAAGKTEEALAHQRAALALLEGTLGPDHPEVARALEAIALLHLQRRELELAKPLLERATSMRDQALGAEDPTLGTTLRLLCDVYGSQHAWAKAEECLARAVAVEEKRQSDAGLVPALIDLARVHEAQQKTQLALASYQRAAMLSERMANTSQPAMSAALRGVASAYLALKEPEKARLALERAVALADGSGDLEQTVRARIQLIRLLKGPQQRFMVVKAREEASRCGSPCLALTRELDPGMARAPAGNGGALRAPIRR